jgi:hypothetical protein
MTRRLGNRSWRVAGAAAAIFASAGVAYAAGPDSGSGVVNGCYGERTGILRVVDAEAGKTCLGFETSISWNERPAGPAGPAGPVSLVSRAGTRSPSSHCKPGSPFGPGSPCSSRAPAGSSLAATAQGGTP